MSNKPEDTNAGSIYPPSPRFKSTLEEYERSGDDKPPFILTYAEMKLLGIAGVGFFLDAYDLFIINPVATMLQFRLYGGESLPAGLEGFVKAAANIGSVVGQFAFGYMADRFGRKAIYGKELMLIIFATILCISDPTGSLSPNSALIYLGLSLIPAFGTLYQRLTLPESTRYLKSTEAKKDEEDPIAELKKKADASVDVPEKPEDADSSATSDETPSPTITTEQQTTGHKAHFTEFIRYFSEWRHAKILIGTCACWFLLDIAFYGINLNQNVVLQQIGFAGKTGTPWERLFKISIGNIIITVLGFVPGYYVTVLTIEKLGRKWIQIQGFLMAALFLGIMAGKFNTMNTASFVVCFAFLLFFFNFGANATTYCYPAEVFPTRYRATAHGISAASGKAGAIISSLAFNTLSRKIGTPNVMWTVTLTLPEVRGRDPDEVLAQEEREKRAS
ncbi:hypothetical protein EW146_g159 [Bondarzewia mesenterica]|uniref:Major facilitator superfamily (MFS) profile domain-containing protein n=1 Tax=Bondarzewia mesenterica TaxID=1095465 RepID=A0A4S4M879_9AGAM|nr:hypothetical protein EW146_g159 [Bondarzewia mesenterica]